MEIPGNEEMRVDKWLWAARFFKTRSLAASSCELGRVGSNGQGMKPSRDVKPGDFLQITNGSGEFEVEVLALSEMRGPASVAQTLYRETDKSREARQKAAEERRLMPTFEVLHEGRPSKRDRRRLIRVRGRG
jgi:ribosome-associated heat shock protein Hsp15